MDIGQFYFTPEHPYSSAKKKLTCLNRLPELTNNMVCVLKNMKTVTLTYKIGVTNLDFTLGLAENLDNQNRKINDLLLPCTLRVKDRAIENSDDGDIVDFIFMRDASKEKYDMLLFADPDKNIPKSIKELLDTHSDVY